MRDETYAFIEDVKERKSMANGARHKKSGAKSRSVTLSQDHMSETQLRRRNSTVLSYSMNKPMKWETFCKLNPDTQAAYLTGLITRYNGTSQSVADMLGVTRGTVRVWCINHNYAGFSGCHRLSSKARAVWDQFIAQDISLTDDVALVSGSDTVLPVTPDPAPAAAPTDAPSAPLSFAAAAQAPIRKASSLYFSFTGTANTVLNYLLSCDVGRDNDIIFDIDITLKEHGE